MMIPVGRVTPGSVVCYHNTPCIVLGASGQNKNIMLMIANAILCVFGKTNDFTDSSLRKYLNGDFLTALTQGHPKEIIPRTVDLTAHNGSVEYDRAGAVRIAPLTFDELRVRYFSVVPRLTEPEWSATPWSTSLMNEDSSRVLCASRNDDFVPRLSTNEHLCRPAGGAYFYPAATAAGKRIAI